MFARRASATYERCSVACIICAMDVASSNLEVADGAPAMRMPTAFATVRPQARAISCCPNAHVSGSFGRGTGDSQ